MELEIKDPGSYGSGVRTFLVFLDLPKHVEFRASGFPLLPVEAVVDFDLTVVDPNTKKAWELKGPYRVERRVLKFSNGRSGRSGFSQYLELDPWKGAPPP